MHDRIYAWHMYQCWNYMHIRNMGISEKYVNVRNYACILKSTEYNSTKSGLQVFLVCVV